MDIIIMGLGAVGLELAESLSAKNGINVAVVDTITQHEATMEISRIIRFPSAIKGDRFSEGKVELIEIKVPENRLLQVLSSRIFPSPHLLPQSMA